MRDDLRERREETWRRLVVMGSDYGDVVSKIASKYDISEKGVESDISRMDSWVSDLDEHDLNSGYSRLRELRKTRQRMQQMALEARRDKDRGNEIDIQKQIVWMLKQDVELAQSLGLTPEEPDTTELTGEDGSAVEFTLSSEDKDALDNRFGGDGNS